MWSVRQTDVGQAHQTDVGQALQTEWRVNFRGNETQVKKAGLTHPKHRQGQFRVILVLLFIIFPELLAADASEKSPSSQLPSQSRIEYPFVVTQAPKGSTKQQSTGVGGVGRIDPPHEWRINFGDGARLVKVSGFGKDESIKVISGGFHSACDPEISFDGSHILFAGKRVAVDHWNIFEMTIDGLDVKQITDNLGDCRSPSYQATLYTLDSPKPWYELTFVRSEGGELNEYGVGPVTSLYSCKLDGSTLRRLTFNLSSDMDPSIMYDGRILFARQLASRSSMDQRLALFAVNIDGTDCALFSTGGGKPVKLMPCTTKELAVFVEADTLAWDGGGTLGCVTLRRPLHSYRQITKQSDGFFHSPSPLPDGKILVSQRPADNTGSYGVYLLDPSTGQSKLIFDSPDYHDIQPKAIYRRQEPDGRSSVVSEDDPNGKLYCLNVYISDFNQPEWLPAGTVKKLRVLEGISVTKETIDSAADVRGSGLAGIISIAQRRILGEIPVEDDGSFNIELPANTPLELQTLDSNGMALRACGWIWVKNHEPRGCIGCHEDGELTPENTFVKALGRASMKLTLPPERRRTVDFRRDVMPIISKKCLVCHTAPSAAPHFASERALIIQQGRKAYFASCYEKLLAGGEQSGRGKYVAPGTARTSPLIWHIFGHNTSRPWDNSICLREPILKMPPEGSEALTEDEKRTFVEWIDMGALWDGIVGPDNLPGN